MQIQKIQEQEVDSYVEANNLYTLWASWSNFGSIVSIYVFFKEKKERKYLKCFNKFVSECILPKSPKCY